MKKLIFLLFLIASCETARDPDTCCTQCWIVTYYDRPDQVPIRVVAGPYEFCDSLEKADAKQWVIANTYDDPENYMKQKASCRMGKSY